MGIEWKVLTPALEKAKAKLSNDDIIAAIKEFKEKTGTTPALMAINPKNSGLEIPEGLEIIEKPGALLYEVWLSPSNITDKPPNQNLGELSPPLEGYDLDKPKQGVLW